MRKTWILVSVALITTACVQLNPVEMYRAAARQLNFSLDSVEPRLELTFPLDQSRVVLRLKVGVDNPSKVHFKLRGFTGRILLEEGQATHSIGGLGLPQGLDLPATQRASIPVDLSFTYRDLKDIWGPLSSTVKSRRAATWRMEGEAQLDAMGFTFNIPVRASKRTGGP
jgi:hypothetical protein